MAVDAGATQAGMAMAGVVQSGPGEYQAQVASGVGTSQEGEAMALLSYARQLATQQGVYWLVPDSEAAVGALRTYQEGGHCRDGIHHLYATVLGGQRLSPRSAINVVTTPSHWITDLNVRVDAATREPPEIDLTWLLRRPYSCIPPVPFRDQCQLSPTALSDWLQSRASIPAQAIYEARWGVNFMPGGGLPLDWLDHDQQRHITAHRIDNVPTMTVLAHRSSHRGTVLDTTCLLCGTQPETAPHLWACSAQSHEWGPARRRLAAWLDQKAGPRAAPVRHQLWEPTVLEQWAAALRTPSMQLAHLECTGPHSQGTEFPPPRRGGVHTDLVRQRQGACHTAEGPPGPGQHDGVGIAGAAPAPASRKGRGAAGAPGISAVAGGELTRSPRLPLPLLRPTHLRTARTQHTQPSPFTFTRG